MCCFECDSTLQIILSWLIGVVPILNIRFALVRSKTSISGPEIRLTLNIFHKLCGRRVVKLGLRIRNPSQMRVTKIHVGIFEAQNG